MCQLLGLSFNRPVTADFSLRGLETQVEGDPMYRNRNGWGIALFQENAALVIKEPLSATRSSLFETIRNLPLTSATFLAHIRFSTRGNDSLKTLILSAGKSAGAMSSLRTTAHWATPFWPSTRAATSPLETRIPSVRFCTCYTAPSRPKACIQST